MSDATRSVVIRLITEFATTGAPPDMQPLAAAQKSVKDAASEATYALKGEGYALKESTNAEMDAIVAMKVAETQREKAINTILEEANAIKETGRAHNEAAHAHQAHGHGLASLARPMTMVINSTMHLAHATALLTAANEKDGEEMARSLLKYEGWIQGVTSSLHLLHGLSHAYEIVSKNAIVAAAAEALAAAPLLPLAAGVAAIAAAGLAIWGFVDAFDVFGSQARKAAEESEKTTQSILKMAAAIREFNREASATRFEASEKTFDIRVKTDQRFNPAARLKELTEERERLAKEGEDAQKNIDKAKSRHKSELKQLDKEIVENPKSVWSISAEGVHEGQEADRKKRMAELELQHGKELEDLGESLKKNAEQKAAVEARYVDTLSQQRDILKQQLETRLQDVKAAEEAARASRGEQRHDQQHFGELNEAQRAELRRIREKHKAGQELNVNELKHLAQFGAAAEKRYVDEKNREKGVLAGADKDQVRLKGDQGGTDEGIKSAESRAGEARRQLGQIQKQLNAKEEELHKAGQDWMASVKSVSEITIKYLTEVKLQNKKLEETIQKLRDNN